MDKGIVNILKSHGCGYMADDYKEIIEEIETFIKKREKAIDVVSIYCECDKYPSRYEESNNYCYDCEKPLN